MSKIYFTPEQITELEQFFKAHKPTPEVIIFGRYAKITNQELFIKSHFAVIKANSGKRIAFAYFNRLRAFRKYLEYKK